MAEYTFTFNPDDEMRFYGCLGRLEDDEYTIIKELSLVKPEDSRNSQRTIVMTMEAEAALTFRFGMKDVTIRRTLNEEELIEEKRIHDMNTIRVNVKVNNS